MNILLSDSLRPALSALARHLHARLAWRLPVLVVGVLFACGRRTVTSWLRAADVGSDFRADYYFLGSLGRRVHDCAISLLWLLVDKMAPGPRWLFALDDSPSKRYGPHVEGAGRHHNPTPGPIDQKYLYGHVWVTLAWLVPHCLWGTLALPLLSKLYVRQCDLGKLMPWYQWSFATKLQLAGDLLVWLSKWLQRSGKAVWVVVDGFYTKRAFLHVARAQHITVVGRLRKDAALRDVPRPPRAGRRGRPRRYGRHRLSLAKRAAHPLGWQTVQAYQYGEYKTKTIKTFLATWRPAQGLIRVVIVKETHGWLAFGCTDTEATAEAILAAAADRGAIEQCFHDIKEVHGAGQQQVRNLWANRAVWHLVLWVYALIEWWSWDRSHEQLVDRQSSPWDSGERRPSHADKRKALQRESLETTFLGTGLFARLPRIIRQLIQRLVYNIV